MAAANPSMSDTTSRKQAGTPSPFALFGLPETFRLDLDRLESAYQRAILAVHPDRFAGRSAAERRVAEQWSARINEAHALLQDPVRRAAWLCEAAGTPLNAETDTKMPPDFLMAQIERREALDGANSLESVDALLNDVERDAEQLVAVIGRAADDEHNWAEAAAAARRLMFLERFIAEAQKKRATYL